MEAPVKKQTLVKASNVSCYFLIELHLQVTDIVQKVHLWEQRLISPAKKSFRSVASEYTVKALREVGIA